MKLRSTMWALAAVLGLAGCGPQGGTGRLVGFVVDGTTGQRLNFFNPNGDKQNVGDNADSDKQVYALVDGQFRRARPCGAGDLTGKNAIHADGCFQIEGIPYGMEIPIFVEAPGYSRFHGTAYLGTPDWENGQTRLQEVANIRIFPAGYTVAYKLLVSYFGQPVQGAKVACQYQPRSGNFQQTSEADFLQPTNVTAGAVTVESDADGVATLPGEQLVNGASYRCNATLAQPFEGRILTGSLDLLAGVDGPEQGLLLQTNDATDEAPYVVSANVDNPGMPQGEQAKLVLRFNRPVELLQNTADCAVALLNTADVDADGRVATFATNTPGNNESETVEATMAADGMTLTVGFRAPTQAFDPDDKGTWVRFNGVILRTKGGSDAASVRYLGDYPSWCGAAFVYGEVAPLQNSRTRGSQNSTVVVF